jgi:5'-nucleotidase (lipoprotein e(P4) family)
MRMISKPFQRILPSAFLGGLFLGLCLSPVHADEALRKNICIRWPVTLETEQTPPDTLSANDRLAATLTQSFRECFAATIEQAKAQLKRQPRRRAAVVLDLDETLMDNRAFFARYQTYAPDTWNTWVMTGEAPAIPETLAFVDWLNKKGYAVYFVSGRKEDQRAVTEANLKRMGVKQYAGLYLKPDVYTAPSAAAFKTKAREDIEAKGRKIVLVMGDQKSDLSGSPHGVLLPNPIYVIP